MSLSDNTGVLPHIHDTISLVIVSEVPGYRICGNVREHHRRLPRRFDFPVS